MKRNKMGFGGIFAYTIMIGIVCFLSLLNYIENGDLVRSRILMHELFAMRSAVTSYAVFNGSFPINLDIAFEKICGHKKSCVEIPRNESGRFMDPFGNAYFYDPLKGFVKSNTKKYEAW